MKIKKKNKTEVFKLQRAIMGGDEVLAYNRSRSIMGQFPLSKDLRKLFGDKYKIYVNGKYNEKTGQIEIISISEIEF